MDPDSHTRQSLIYPSISVNASSTTASDPIPKGPEGEDVVRGGSHQILLSLAVLPVIIAILGNKSALQWLQDWGDQTEEVFTSERLPLLPFPEKKSS